MFDAFRLAIARVFIPFHSGTTNGRPECIRDSPFAALVQQTRRRFRDRGVPE